MEATWEQPNGDIWGLQAKFFFTLGISEKRQMEKSLRQALTIYPDLKRYTFCIPIHLTGPGAGGGGKKSQITTLESWIAEWKKIPQVRKSKIEIDWWDFTQLSDRLHAADPLGGRTIYWFDKTVLTPDWFKKHLDATIRQAGARYSPKLRVDVPVFDAFAAFERSEEWAKNTEDLRNSLSDALKRWRDLEARRHKDPTLSELALEIKPIAAQFSEIAASALEKLKAALESNGSEENLGIVRQHLKEALERGADCERMLKDDLIKDYGPGADSPGFRQFEAEYNVHFPAAGLDAARDLLEVLRTADSYFSAVHSTLAVSSRMLVTGPSGIGKTHAIVDYAVMRKVLDRPSVVLFGEDFSTDDPWLTIATKLGFGTGIDRTQLFTMLDAAAEAASAPLIIFIDALNETQPDRRKWKVWLPVLSAELEHYAHLKLCISCRDTFLQEVIPETEEIPSVIHNGFAGREFDSYRQFFDFYRLPAPGMPLLQPEFTNPFFLHLVCQGIAANTSAVPLERLGLSAIIHRFLEVKNLVIATALDYDKREDRVRRAIDRIVTKLAANHASSLPLVDARGAVETLYPSSTNSMSLFDQLEREGIIAVISISTGQGNDFSVRFAFERLYDHRLAEHYLEGTTKQDIRSLFGQGGGLHFAVKDVSSSQQHRGLLEAISIIMPERFDIELDEVVDHSLRREIAFPPILAGLQWRDPNSVTPRTERIIRDALRTSNLAALAMNTILALSVRPNHRLNAGFLHGLLSGLPLKSRDGFWALTLYKSFERQGIVFQLIDWSHRSNLNALSPDAVFLWATTLAWFCASPDRRIRDRSTKGLVRLLASCPAIIDALAVQFQDCDDDYVFERVLVSSYGALLLSHDEDALLAAARSMHRLLLNAAHKTNAVIRDHARLIVESAKDALRDQFAIDVKGVRPPYESPWPLHLPTQSDVSPFIDDKDRFPRPMAEDAMEGNTLGTDFAHYILQPRVTSSFDMQSAGLDQRGICRWFLKSAANMGYPGANDLCAQYDFLMLQTYGGGRARKGWAERIGKKYYWILLHRLVGLCADHLPPMSYWRPVPEPESGIPRLQGLDLRDIDPTDLRFLRRNDSSNSEASWRPSSPYIFSKYDDAHRKWALINNFSKLKEALSSNQLPGAVPSIVVSENMSWRLSPRSKDSEYPYRLVSRSIESGLLRADEVAGFSKVVKQRQFSSDVHNFEPNDYRGYLGEYPNSFVYRSREDADEFLAPQEVHGYSMSPSAMVQLKGAEWGYDYSDDQKSVSLLMPSPDIVNFGSLIWNGDRGWVDANGVQQALAFTSDTGGSSLIVSRKYMQDLLVDKKLALVWFVFEQKLVITGSIGNDFLGSIERRSAYILSGGTIRLLGEQVTRRKASSHSEKTRSRTPQQTTTAKKTVITARRAGRSGSP